MEDRVKRIEKALDHFLPERKGSLSETVTDAMRYSLLNGGKRVRAVLTLAFCELCGGDEDMAMPLRVPWRWYTRIRSSTMTCRAWIMTICAAVSPLTTRSTVKITHCLRVTAF